MEATADDSGIFIDGKPLVLRKDIQQAYIRPHQDAQSIESRTQFGRMFIDLPNYPLTVEIIRRDGTSLNIDPGGETGGRRAPHRPWYSHHDGPTQLRRQWWGPSLARGLKSSFIHPI